MFGFSAFDADGDGSVGDQMAERRLDPVGARHRAGHSVQRSPLPKKPTPSHDDLHSHLDDAKKASSDDEKRQHVFKALSALRRRNKAFGKTHLPDMGAS